MDLYKLGSFQMVSMTKIDENCCRMKSVNGYCPKPLESVSNYLSKKWTMSILITIDNFRILRFNELLKRIEGTTAKILSHRLKELEEENLILRKLFNEVPPKVEYSLTKKGEKLTKALLPLIVWAESKK